MSSTHAKAVITGESLANELSGDGRTVTAIEADVTDPDSLRVGA